MRARVLVAGGHEATQELQSAASLIELVGHVRSLDTAEAAMRALRPSVLVLDGDLTHNDGLCALPALRRASPETAIVLPPARPTGPRLVRAVRLAAGGSTPRRDEDDLTARERDIVRLVALGHTSREIADRLVLSVRTVETHRARVQKRLAVTARAELVRWALDHGLLEP
jgi:two-component system response regulator NreC